MHLSLQDGDTPLMAASRGGHVRCVLLLLDKGAQINHQNKVRTFWDQSSVSKTLSHVLKRAPPPLFISSLLFLSF